MLLKNKFCQNIILCSEHIQFSGEDSVIWFGSYSLALGENLCLHMLRVKSNKSTGFRQKLKEKVCLCVDTSCMPLY